MEGAVDVVLNEAVTIGQIGKERATTAKRKAQCGSKKEVSDKSHVTLATSSVTFT